MEIRTDVLKRSVVVIVSGRIDSAHAPELESTLLDLIQAGNRNLVVNMKDADIITSAGLRALIAARIKVRRMVPRGEVVLSELPPFIYDSIELVGFHHLFPVFDTDIDAVGSF